MKPTPPTNLTNASRPAVRAACMAAALFVVAFARFFVLPPEGRGNVLIALLGVAPAPLPHRRDATGTTVGAGRRVRLARRRYRDGSGRGPSSGVGAGLQEGRHLQDQGEAQDRPVAVRRVIGKYCLKCRR